MKITGKHNSLPDGDFDNIFKIKIKCEYNGYPTSDTTMYTFDFDTFILNNLICSNAVYYFSQKGLKYITIMHLATGELQVTIVAKYYPIYVISICDVNMKIGSILRVNIYENLGKIFMESDVVEAKNV